MHACITEMSEKKKKNRDPAAYITNSQRNKYHKYNSDLLLNVEAFINHLSELYA